MSMALERNSSMGAPIAFSALLHLAAAAALIFSRTGSRAATVPTYRVNLVAAPPGERQVGVVQPAAPAPTTPVTTPPPVAREAPAKAKALPKTKAKPVPRPKVATPNSAPAAAQQ